MQTIPVRIDKWLWAVRIYKTRILAAEQCKGGHVKIKGQKVKPSRLVHVDEIICVRKRGFEFSYKVLGYLDKRVSAKEANVC